MNTLTKAAQGSLRSALGIAKRLVAQIGNRNAMGNRATLYSWHAPEVEYIFKGKGRYPYKFGMKVGLSMNLKEILIVIARSVPGKPYGGHTVHVLPPTEN